MCNGRALGVEHLSYLRLRRCRREMSRSLAPLHSANCCVETDVWEFALCNSGRRLERRQRPGSRVESRGSEHCPPAWLMWNQACLVRFSVRTDVRLMVF